MITLLRRKFASKVIKRHIKKFFFEVLVPLQDTYFYKDQNYQSICSLIPNLFLYYPNNHICFEVFQTAHNPSQYFSWLGQSRHFQKVLHENFLFLLYLENQNQSQFYSKLKQACFLTLMRFLQHRQVLYKSGHLHFLLHSIYKIL